MASGTHWAPDVWSRRALRSHIVRDVLRLMYVDREEFARIYERKRAQVIAARNRESARRRDMRRATEAARCE